jgi:hypothetical protein
MLLTVKQLCALIREGVLEAPPRLVEDLLAWFTPRAYIMYANHSRRSYVPGAVNRTLRRRVKDYDIAFEDGSDADKVSGKVYLRLDGWKHAKQARSHMLIDVVLTLATDRAAFFRANNDGGDSIGTIFIALENIFLKGPTRSADDYLDAVDSQIDEMRITIRHEAIHAAQQELSHQVGRVDDRESPNVGRGVGGAPRSLRKQEKRREKEPDATAQPPHHLRDVEFHARITDVINDVIKLWGMKHSGEQYLDADYKDVIYYLANRSSITAMRRDDFARYKIAAKYVLNYLVKHWQLGKY